MPAEYAAEIEANISRSPLAANPDRRRVDKLLICMGEDFRCQFAGAPMLVTLLGALSSKINISSRS